MWRSPPPTRGSRTVSGVPGDTRTASGMPREPSLMRRLRGKRLLVRRSLCEARGVVLQRRIEAIFEAEEACKVDGEAGRDVGGSEGVAGDVGALAKGCRQRGRLANEHLDRLLGAPVLLLVVGCE